MDFTANIHGYLDGLTAAVAALDKAALNKAAELIFDAHMAEHAVYSAGSAHTADAFAQSLREGCAVLGRTGVKATYFAKNAADSLATFAKRGDVLVCFAGSKCDCMVKAAAYAKSIGMSVIGFVTDPESELLPLCDVSLITAEVCPVKVADLQNAAAHAIVSSLRAALIDAWGMEVIFPPVPGREFKFALFDFDGTLSLIREGWQQIMIPYFCEEVTNTPMGKDEDPEAIKACVTEFVDMLTGKQTIYQCMALADEVKKRGGTPLDPLDYKNEYLRRLMEKIKDRREGLANGTIDRETLLVRGSVPLLEALKREGVTLYLASGTDQPQVREEAALLGLDQYFDGNIYGALDEHLTSCTKELVIKRLLAENGLDGTELLSFGDGFVEIELVSNLGGYPIAVATDESRKFGIDTWKRDRLVKAGAGAVIPDFECAERVVSYILGK